MTISKFKKDNFNAANVNKASLKEAVLKQIKPDEAFVWVWLSGSNEPVVAGKIYSEGKKYNFIYGQSYLARSNAISLFLDELPLQAGIIEPATNLEMAGCLRDASPDAWGRRVIIYRQQIDRARRGTLAELDELTYLLASGSDRIGMLDFQQSATDYKPRIAGSATLEELMEAALCVEKGLPMNPALEKALLHGSSIGGARPKVLIESEYKKYIAKFSSSNDIYSVVKAEYIAMRLASIAGINAAQVKLEKASGKDVLLIERFDRVLIEGKWTRKGLVSALTILGLNEMEARYASYADLAEIIRLNFDQPKKTLKELFNRMVFNVLCGNSDDHARNHSAFWDGRQLKLAPAYDICPQSRAGQESSQAMLLYNGDNHSRFSGCIEAANEFMLSKDQAVDIILNQVGVLVRNWNILCDDAVITSVERNLFIGRQFLNPYSYQDLDQKFPVVYDACVDAIERLQPR
jgi:serine/threonine-protein kinase HipA